MIVSITGPSGVGKTTLMHNLVRKLPHALPLMSYTTRPARPSDEPGEYTYITRDAFEQMAASDKFLWEARTTSNLYGTLKSDVDTALAVGICLPILVLEAAEALHRYSMAVDKANLVTYLYVEIDNETELRSRFKERGDKQEEVEARLAECRDWNARAHASSVPFIFLPATRTREEILADALAHLKLGR